MEAERPAEGLICRSSSTTLGLTFDPDSKAVDAEN
jgi:hypothetical protein